MTEVVRFSPWCQMCLDGEDKGRIDAHALHVLRLKRERAKQVSKLPWRWQLLHTEKPLPRGSGQGPELATPASYIDQQAEPAQSISGQADHAPDDELA